jgi:hypothetical protein
MGGHNSDPIGRRGDVSQSVVDWDVWVLASQHNLEQPRLLSRHIGGVHHHDDIPGGIEKKPMYETDRADQTHWQTVLATGRVTTSVAARSHHAHRVMIRGRARRAVVKRAAEMMRADARLPSAE